MSSQVINTKPDTGVDEALLRELMRSQLNPARIPSSVYRLQMCKELTFKQATGIIPYLKQLGVSTVYCSPYFQASPGSMHGYNITDPGRVNEEIGTPEDYETFCSAIREQGLTHLVDVVPNHMGITGVNRYWLDVLENGPSSIYAKFFDINWQPEKRELKEKVLIPILGDAYGKVLENGELKLVYAGKGLQCRYWETELPINPKTYPAVLEYGIEELREKLGEQNPDLLEYLSVITAFRNLPGGAETDNAKVNERHREKEISKNRLAAVIQNSAAVREFVDGRLKIFNGEGGIPDSFDLLNDLLNDQSFRVAFWRVASEEINYRRFFDINELAALRIEDDEVFEEHHRFVFDLVAEGKVQGLRIDHPDGLYDPPEYFSNLQKRFIWNAVVRSLKDRGVLQEGDAANLAQARKTFDQLIKEPEFIGAKPLYVVIEKILDLEERLPSAWKVHGTVGYECLNILNGLFVDSSSQKDFFSLYEKFIGHAIDFDQLIYDKKKYFALIHMSSEINNLGSKLKTISEKHRHFRDFTRANLTLALREIIACFPVYRTYISPSDETVSGRDEKYILTAVNKARRRTPALAGAVYDFVRDVLMLKLEHLMQTAEDKYLFRDFVLRFQQLTGPVMAKGLEDTSFYIFNRLLSLNEVGGDPNHFGCSISEFHRMNQAIVEKWQGNLFPGSTHDTKRSEDVRMRLDVLSEIPEEWENQVQKWSRINEKHRCMLEQKVEPRRNTEYFIYQTLLGVWPDEDVSESAMPAFMGRIWEYVEKALREAKIYTNWVNPDAEYEGAVKKFIDGILGDTAEKGFLTEFRSFQKKIARYGKMNALSALTLRLASPGVVDIYQGTELWNYALVDPDNRRQVDFDLRRKMLTAVQTQDKAGGTQCFKDPADGAAKLFVIQSALKLREKDQGLFVKGAYLPLKAEGEKAEHVVAYLRTYENRFVLCAAGRFFAKLDPAETAGPAAWKDTIVMLPQEASGKVWRDIFTGKEFRCESRDGNEFLRIENLFQTSNAAILAAE